MGERVDERGGVTEVGLRGGDESGGQEELAGER